MAESTLCVEKDAPRPKPQVVHVEPEKLSAGHAKRTGSGFGAGQLGAPGSRRVRNVDPEARTETPAGMVGEIWTQGENVAIGYWLMPADTAHTFGAQIVDASPETVDNHWLRTGDLGFISEGELFIIGRMKDLLIVRGRNHYPDDIEATVSAISGGRVAAIADPAAGDRTAGRRG